MVSKLELNYPEVISQLERLLKKFNLKKKFYRLLFRGRGLEFEQFRNFDENEDDADSIDWTASLKSDKILVRQYKEESDVNFYFVIDSSKNMLFGSGKKLKAEYSAEIALALAYLAISSQDKAGLLMFSNNLVKYVPPNNLKNNIFTMEDCLSNISLYGGVMNFEKAIDSLLGLIKNRRNVVVFLSDFLNLTPDIEKKFNILANRCEVLALVIKDKLDLELPKTSNPLTLSNSSGTQAFVVDTEIAERAYKNIVDNQLKHMQNIFRECNIDFLEITSNEPFILPLISFLQSRSGEK